MKRFLLMMSIMIAIIIALPFAASANADRDNVEALLDEWLDYADQEDFNVLDSDVDTVDTETIMTYTIDLEEGDYIIFAQSGDNIVDLNLAGYHKDDYDEGNDPFIEDTLDDNVPVLEFTLRHARTLVVTVTPAEFARHKDSGYFCIIFAEK
jgi:hypothetical protein